MNLIDNLHHQISVDLTKSWVRAYGHPTTGGWRQWPPGDSASARLRATVELSTGMLRADPNADEVSRAAQTVAASFFEQERLTLLRDYCWRDKTHPRTYVAQAHALFTAPAYVEDQQWVREVILNRSNLAELIKHSTDAEAWQGASFTPTTTRDKILAGCIGGVDRKRSAEGYLVCTGPAGFIEPIELDTAWWLGERPFEYELGELIVDAVEAAGQLRIEVEQFLALRVRGRMTLVSRV